jgi:hypothetical protein
VFLEFFYFSASKSSFRLSINSSSCFGVVLLGWASWGCDLDFSPLELFGF